MCGLVNGAVYAWAAGHWLVESKLALFAVGPDADGNTVHVLHLLDRVPGESKNTGRVQSSGLTHWSDREEFSLAHHPCSVTLPLLLSLCRSHPRRPENVPQELLIRSTPTGKSSQQEQPKKRLSDWSKESLLLFSALLLFHYVVMRLPAISLALLIIIKLSKKRLRLSLGAPSFYHGSSMHHAIAMNHLGIKCLDPLLIGPFT